MIKAVSKDFRIQPFRYNKTDKELLRIIYFLCWIYLSV